MTIDFHAHVFPAKIAEPTVKALALASENVPYANGAYAGLVDQCRMAGVDVAVNLPVLTKPTQFDGTNRFAKAINERFTGKGVLSFGGIHPLCEDVRGKMRALKEQGFLGVKIHPDYQGTYIDDDSYYEVLKCAKDEGLIVVTHAGVDMGFSGQPVKCTPERASALLARLGGYDRFVLAHCGGSDMFDEVITNLCGKDVLFDTAYALPRIGKERFLEIVDRHGADKILFATDSPWRDSSEQVAIIKGYGLSADVERKILGDNAKRLLGLEEI